MIPGPWSKQAACRGQTETMTIPRGNPGRYPSRDRMRRVARAQAICATCPVLTECSAYADQLDHHGQPIVEMVIAGRAPWQPTWRQRHA